MSTKLSLHFSLSEFTKSQDAIRNGIDNTPNPDQVEALRQLCQNVLEPIRIHFGKPVSVSSGFRSQVLNTRVGGSATSSHCFGEAADIEIFGVSNPDLAKWIVANLNFDQVILEFYNAEEGINSGWVHVSFKKKGNRKQALTAKKVNGKTTYLPGILS